MPTDLQPPRLLGRHRPRGGRPGFTLVEMLTTVALLIIVLGLMVSLARYVRRRSAEDLTRKVLVNLHMAMLEYAGRNGAPAIDPVARGRTANEADLQRAAIINNRELIRFFRSNKDLSAMAFRDLPLSIYDESTVRDAWGTPIVFMPTQHPMIGMAASNDKWFFFSAGPDRLYLTRDDNQYSYEALEAGEP